MPLLWTINDETKFHQAIAQLSKLRQTPLQEANYRHQYRGGPQSSDHVLRLEDEMQLADHVAFIAHSSEGFPEIAAACIEERPDQQGLLIRLARNELRRTEEVKSIRCLLRVLEGCASGGMLAILLDVRQQLTWEVLHRNAVQDRLFNEVLAISENRILQRLMPPWYPAPSHWNAKQRQKRTSLHYRMTTLLLPKLRGSKFERIYLNLTDVIEALEPLESKQVGPDLHKHVKIAVQCCANASIGTEQKSLELQLKHILNQLSEAARKVVVQIDKIARYLNLSRDLAKMVMRKAYRNIFKEITLKPLLSPSPVLPNGTANLCFVHAEVQLILHYERVSCVPTPRFIGCSKSACFLCDLLIKRHGRFQISFAHQRIYPKWTMPNVDWMTQKQIEAWRKTINGMVQELQVMIRKFTADKEGFLSAPMESRACLPLSSVPSSVAIPGGMADSGTFTGEIQEGLPVLQQGPPSVSYAFLSKESSVPLEISSNDLPISYKVSVDFPGFHFISSQLTVFFEFDRDFSGTVSLAMVAETSAAIRSFAVDDLVHRNDFRVAPIRADEGLVLRLQVRAIDVLHVELMWDSE
ncbi:ott 1508-like deaminase [Colletotrichum incanum]|uniref:Ott 1508-like deaminase n=1 Tax=Colletotrichum incanum TaxID=1573173 RepID=A0A166MZZ0_COLIC|nr:ott 1508-like deaminase [Colletotrichum incanum]